MNNRLFRSPEAGWASMGTEGYLPQLDPKYGDFITPEQHIPATGMPGVDWETCMTMNTTWGYSEHDHAWKSDEDADPQPDRHRQQRRQLPAEHRPQRRRQRAGGKRQVDARDRRVDEGRTASPFTAPPPARSAQWPGAASPPSQARLYLHVFDWPKDGKLLLPATCSAGEPKASLLAKNSRDKLPVIITNSGVEISLPPQAPDPVATVIRLDGAFSAIPGK